MELKRTNHEDPSPIDIDFWVMQDALLLCCAKRYRPQRTTCDCATVGRVAARRAKQHPSNLLLIRVCHQFE